jgi:hypothetical protein
MARGAFYLFRCSHGEHRYWRAFPWKGFACTHEELPREVARSASVNLLHVVAFTYEMNGELARLKGTEWVKDGTLHAGKPA